MGGNKQFVSKLQSVFDNGLYDPANEPDIAYPYLFTHFAGQEYRTSNEVGRLLDTYFTAEPDGIPGNDDAGTMSAWAVFSMIGLYPDCPGVPEYALTELTFDKVTIHLNPDYYDNATLVIEKAGKGHGAVAQGKKTGYRISHSDLVRCGNLKIHSNAKKHK